MVLSPVISYPQSLAYVIRLHHDCARDARVFAGRVEHVASGRQFEFGSAEELIACLVRDAASNNTDSFGSTP